MARKKQEPLLNDMFAIAAKLPSWVGIVLAVVSYLALHHFATIELGSAGGSNGLSVFFVAQFFKTLATIMQYFVPLVFIAGAAVSAVKRRGSRSRIIDISPIARRLAARKRNPALPPPENDFYSINKPAGAAALPRSDAWSIELLRVIDWKLFEDVCAEYFRLLGFRAETQTHGPDGGIDIALRTADNPDHIGALVQCKRWRSTMVGPKEVRELLGVMTDRQVTEGIFVTASGFHREAVRLAKDNHIDLIDGKILLARIMELVPAQQAQLLAVATQGEYLTPTCPSCGIKLVARESSKDQSKFWGCTNYPRCRYTAVLGPLM